MRNNCNNVICCLEKKDYETLKSMFCKKLIEHDNNIDEEIENAMMFFQGNITSYGNVLYGDDDSFINGECVKFIASPSIDSITTDIGKEYTVIYNEHIIDAENPEKIGISYIEIIDENNDSCQIGDFYIVNPDHHW